MVNGFWYNLGSRGSITYKPALKYKRCLNKARKCDPHIQFLHNCKSNVANPKFIRSKIIPTKNEQYQNAFYARLLSNEIKEKDFNKELLKCLGNLQNCTTWMKAQIIKYSVNCYINKQMAKLKERQKKKLDGLIAEKNIQDGLQNNSNNLISILRGKTISATEIEILTYGLKRGLATRPSEVEMIIIAENIWDQIEQKGLCNHFMKQERVKTALRDLLIL